MCLDPRNPTHQFICLLLAVILLIGPANLWAGEVVVQEVVQGSATITQELNNTFIQADDNTIINYTQFDVDLGESATFIQPNSSSRVLNRVISTDPSYLLGTIAANGQVYFVNQSGVVIGENAVINAASFYAAAGNISDSDFLAGTDRFTTSGGVLSNAGTINAPEGVTLIGGKVLNSGTIVSGRGVVALCAGDEVYLAENGSGVKVRVDNLDAATGQGDTPSVASTEAGVLNEGTVSGDEVLFSCGDVYSLAVVNRGQVTASGGAVTMSGNGLVQNEGQIDVSDSRAGAVGGTVKMLGETVVMDDGEIDASGDAGGGTILLGGNYQGNGEERNSSLTFVDAESVIKADALNTGNGGQIIVWSDGATGFYGSLSARGSQSGVGGFAEVSGVQHLGFNGAVNLSGGAGYGTLLLDPTNIIVDDAGAAVYADVSTFAAGGVTETISSATLDAVGGNVALQATTDITVTDALTLNTVDADLAMRAGNDITINAAVTTSDGKITMTANDSGGTQSGAGTLAVNANLSTTGNAEDGDNITLNVSGGTGSVELDAQLDTGVGSLSGDAETVYIMSSSANIQDGISVVNNDGTVYVVGGDTYTENITINKPMSLLGTRSDGTTDAWVVSTVGAHTQAPVLQHNPDPIITVTSDDVTIRGFEVDVTAGAAQEGISVTGSNDNLTIEYCDFSYDDTDTGDLAITFNPEDNNFVFDGVAISWNDFDTTAGVNSWAIVMGNATDLEISNNNFDTGIKFEVGGGGASSHDLLITSNTFKNFASPGIMFIRDGSGAVSSGLQITQNNFNSRSIGIYFFATGDDGAADYDDSLQAGNFSDPVVIDENKFHDFGAGTEIALQVCDETDPVSLAIQIDARNNFWDSVNGPTETNNKLNVGSQGAEISDNSDSDAILVYAPWWSVLTNDVLGAYAGTELSPVYNVQLDTSYASFLLALAAASAGDELQATAGPYAEAVNINKDVTVTVMETGLTGEEDWATATSWASPALTAIELDGNFATEGGNFTFLGDVELTGDTMLNSAGGALQFTNLAGNYNLTLEENIAAGTTTFTGDVSNLGSGVGAALTIEENVTGLVHFQGELGANSGISAVGENVAIQVDDTVALGDGNTATVINGELTIGANCTSLSSYDGLTVDELTVTAGANSFTLASNNGNATFESAIDFNGRDVTINSTTGTTTFQGAVSDVGDGTGASLTVGGGATGLITFESTLGLNSGVSTANGTSTLFQDDVTISGGDTASFVLGSVGLYGMTFTTDGALTMGDDAADVVFLSDAASTVDVENQNVTIGATVYGAQEFTVDAGTGIIQVDGPVGSGTALLDLTLIGGVITTANTVTVDDAVAMTTSTGDLTLGNSITAGGAVTLSAVAGAIVQGAGTVTCDTLDLDSASGVRGPELGAPSVLDDQLFMCSAAQVTADVTGAGNVSIRNDYVGVVTINSLTTDGGYIVFQNTDDLDMFIAGAVTSGTAGVTNGGIIAITSGGAVTVNAAINSQAGAGGNLIVGDNVTLNTAPTVGAGHVLIAGDTDEALTLNLPANEISQVIDRPAVGQAPVEQAISVAERFQAADRNDDGLLSFQEFLGMLAVPNSPGARRLFQAMDMDSDGILTIEEIESYLRYRRGRSASRSVSPGEVQVASMARY